MDDLLREFLTETAESLEIVDVELVNLERDPNDRGTLDKIFRLVHTIKGTCGFLGLPRLETIAHAAETLLGKFRDGEMTVTPPMVTLILESLDRIKAILADLEATQAEPEGDDSDLVGRLAAAAEGAAPEAAEAVTVEPVEAETVEPVEPAESIDPVPLPAQPAGAEPAIAEDRRRSEPSVAGQSIRVNVEVLEDLMTMVSELVLTRNQLLEMVRHLDDSEFKVPLQRLSNVTAELQEGVMKTRMQPIGNAWQKLPRIVRDLTQELGKRVELEMLGADTELDRQVLELIKDPLTHMVRNSADHGLELPAERRAAGKPETGTIRLRAYHEGGHIIIEVADDGRGLNLDKIKRKALDRGLASEADLERMSESQIYKFIFHAGFSTAQAVTSVSGRGVGMDVVRTNIELIGGAVDLRSKQGQGTTFTIKIPLTLAIVSALIVGTGGMRFAIPQLSVVELVRASARGEHRIERINRTPVLRLRNRLLPLIYLSQVLGVTEDSENAEERFVVVSQAGGQVFGIVVDTVFDTEEIVVKPVANALREIPLFSGNTILGDGSVIMIVDPNGVAATIAEEALHAASSGTAAAKRERSEDRTALLVVRAGGGELKAVPLSLVTRLEEVDAERIEHADGRTVVQYRGRLMPLVAAGCGAPFRQEGRQPVIVFADEDRAAGLAVDEIVDIVEEKLTVELDAAQPGIVGTAIVRGEATEILDVAHYLSQAYDDWFHAKSAGGRARRSVAVLAPDAFLRDLIAPLIKAAGYDVRTADRAEHLAGMAEDGETFDLVLADFADAERAAGWLRALRAEPALDGLPVLALASEPHASAGDAAAAGFDGTAPKFDRGGLIAAIDAALTAAAPFQNAA